MHDQDAIHLGFLDQQFQHPVVLFKTGATAQIHGVAGMATRRNDLGQFDAGGGADGGQRTALTNQHIAGQQTDAVAVAHDKQAVVPDRFAAGQSLHRIEQVLDGIDPQDTHAAGSGVVNRLFYRPAAIQPGLKGDDGLKARGQPGRRHKLTRVTDALQVQEDSAGLLILGQIVEQIAEAHIHPGA